MTILETFCTNIETELGHIPLVEAAQKAAFVLLNDEHVQLEGFGDFANGIGRKIGNAAITGALVLSAANANAAPVNKQQTISTNSTNHKQTTNVCSSTVRNAWNNPLYQEIEMKYLQEELDKQQKQVDAGKRSTVNEQMAYDNAQMRAMSEIGCTTN